MRAEQKLRYPRRWQLTPTQRILLDELLRYGDLTDEERDRCRILLWIDAGKTWRAAIRELDISADTITRTTRNFKVGGLEGVLFPSYGDKSCFRPAANSRFRDVLPQLLALARADPPVSLEQIAAATGLSKPSVSRILHRLGVNKVWKKPQMSANGRQRQVTAVRSANRLRQVAS